MGLAWLRDAINPSVKGPLELARIARTPILTAIPYIETRRERTGNGRRLWIATCLVAVLAAVLFLGVYLVLKLW